MDKVLSIYGQGYLGPSRFERISVHSSSVFYLEDLPRPDKRLERRDLRSRPGFTPEGGLYGVILASEVGKIRRGSKIQRRKNQEVL